MPTHLHGRNKWQKRSKNKPICKQKNIFPTKQVWWICVRCFHALDKCLPCPLFLPSRHFLCVTNSLPSLLLSVDRWGENPLPSVYSLDQRDMEKGGRGENGHQCSKRRNRVTKIIEDTLSEYFLKRTKGTATIFSRHPVPCTVDVWVVSVGLTWSLLPVLLSSFPHFKPSS